MYDKCMYMKISQEFGYSLKVGKEYYYICWLFALLKNKLATIHQYIDSVLYMHMHVLFSGSKVKMYGTTVVNCMVPWSLN